MTVVEARAAVTVAVEEKEEAARSYDTCVREEEEKGETRCWPKLSTGVADRV